ncbi:hypothetical protein OPQ81_007595 [Rhizoctonia solani]|nr:hypothetical protein OPQ81_007595 [Rhizoctonia solani]
MERRRQDGVGSLQPLGTKKNRRMGNSGFGEDLGSTDYTERPQIARNPRAKSTQDKDMEDANSRVGSPIVDLDPDESGDPIDFLSAQESQASTSSKKPRPAQSASKSEQLSTLIMRVITSIRTRQRRHQTPQPAPFKRRTQPEETLTIKEKPSTSAPRIPAPPPWKSGAISQVGSKMDTTGGSLDEGNIPPSQRVGESQIDRESLKTVKIPKKNDMSSKAITPVAAKGSRAEPKKTAAFPMAGYAKGAAAKQLDEINRFRSPRKRFKPDEVERILKQAEQDELMGIDDETLPPLDPQSLCPFCDEPFPDNPSPDLMQLLADLKKTAVPEPRLRNPNGLTAPLMTYINLCQMHRAESKYVEQGRRNHWPSVIDWDDVRERLKSSGVVKALRSIIADPHSSGFFVTFYNKIRRDGVLKAASIRAQLDTFELSHPGYYGEQGLLVFFDTLNELFPNLTSEECKPLTTRQFFTSVLVPEAAALLIKQDMDCTYEEALTILRESRQYGLAMFPDRGGFFGSGTGDHMDEAGAKQLKWRKDMVGSSYPGNGPEIALSPIVITRFLEDETDPDLLVVD